MRAVLLGAHAGPSNGRDRVGKRKLLRNRSVSLTERRYVVRLEQSLHAVPRSGQAPALMSFSLPGRMLRPAFETAEAADGVVLLHRK